MKKIFWLSAIALIAILSTSCTAAGPKYSQKEIVTTESSLWDQAGGLFIQDNFIACVPLGPQTFKIIAVTNRGDEEVTAYWYQLQPLNDNNDTCQIGWLPEPDLTAVSPTPTP